MTSRFTPLRWLVAGLAIASTLTGCGSRHPTIAVSGRVTYDGGDWPKPGTMNFLPLEPAEGFERRPGRAEFDTDGNFRAMTWEEGDGLLPGKYRVTVACWERAPSVEYAGSESYVPVVYQSAGQSPWVIDVLPGSDPLVVERDIPKAKP